MMATVPLCLQQKRAGLELIANHRTGRRKKGQVQRECGAKRSIHTGVIHTGRAGGGGAGGVDSSAAFILVLKEMPIVLRRENLTV